MIGSRGLDTQSLQFTVFSPQAQAYALFEALANASLSSVTSLSLINGMPEQVPSPLTTEICALLKHLPRVERLRLCPSYLALRVVWHLRDNPGLCPELKELELSVSATYGIYIFGLVAQVAEDRSGTERRLRRVECFPNGSEQEREGLREVWDWLRKDMELDGYLGDE